MTVNPPDVCSSISALLLQVARLNRTEGDRVLASMGLHSGNELLLGVLWQTDGIRPADAAARLGVSSAAITKSMSRLSRQELIETRASEGDRRSITIHLTAKGRKIRSTLASRMMAMEAELLERLTDREREQFQDLLRKILGAKT